MNDTTPSKVLESARIEKLAALFLLATSIFVGLMAIDRLMDLFDARPPIGTMITVEGEGRVTAIPDIATISFTISEEGANASGAQDAAAKKVNVAIALLDGLGIDEKDIKTTSYSVAPKYNNPQPCFSGFCPPYDQRIIGYTASQTVEVKVRDTDKAGDILSQLGDAGVGNLYGPSFTIDDLDSVKAEAREKAIDAARAKAKVLAKDLSVRLVRVTGFWESGPYPYYYDKTIGMGGAVESAAPARTAPEIPAGENEVVVMVSVSYEIR